MSINRQSSNLIPLDRKSESKFDERPTEANAPFADTKALCHAACRQTKNLYAGTREFDNPDKSFALVQSAQMDRPTTQQKEAISRIYAEQAWIYFQEQNWSQAIAACQNALENNAQNADAYKILGNVLKVQGKKAEALGVYAKALSINPNSAPIYANLGSFHAEQKNWQQALDYFQQAVILDPSLAGAYRSLAQIWEELGNSDQALECFCQAVNLEPERLTAPEYFSFGNQLYQQGKLKEASIFYIQGVKLNPRAESELSQLVKIFEELEQWQQAVVYYQKLISLSSNDLELSDSLESDKPIKNLLSGSQSRTKPRNLPKLASQSHQPSPPKLNSATRQNKSDEVSSSLASLGSITATTTPAKLLPKAETKLAIAPESATKQPNSAVSWNNLGSLYAQKKQWTRAISCYQEALELDPKLCKAHRNLARVYNQTGNKLQSSLCWYQAFTLEPEGVKPEEYFNLARKLLQQQEVDKAIACLRRTIQLKPDFERAYLILGKLFERQGKSKAAQACYEKMKQIHNNEHQQTTINN
ncbi:MAG: tetratricopeptide repeat protein [Cyanobacteria bacterium P01_A01_bin.83]